ncbi:MAG: hypothetical protein RLP44_33070 [Aggregatilineales bacterium]
MKRAESVLVDVRFMLCGVLLVLQRFDGRLGLLTSALHRVLLWLRRLLCTE